MKKILTSIFLTLLLAACANSSAPVVTDVPPVTVDLGEAVMTASAVLPEQKPQVDPMLAQTPKKFVQTGTSGSCASYVVQDEQGKAVEVSVEVTETLECLSGSEVISPNYTFLLFLNNKYELKLYNFEAKTTQTLMSFNKTLEGLECKWNTDGVTIACVAINQAEYKGLTKILVLTIDDNGTLLLKKNFPQQEGKYVTFHCGSTCYPVKFWFDGDKIKYQFGDDSVDEYREQSIAY